MNSIPQDRPYFDLELFLQTAGESRLGGTELEECIALWDAWNGSLRRSEVRDGGCGYLAVWLAESVELAVDAAWNDSPSKGFRLNALAQTLCMCAVHERIPEVAEAGCAPVPGPSENLARQLAEAGLPARAGEFLALGRRYAVVTRYPFCGTCEICALRPTCPRSGGIGDSVFEIGPNTPFV